MKSDQFIILTDTIVYCSNLTFNYYWIYLLQCSMPCKKILHVTINKYWLFIWLSLSHVISWGSTLLVCSYNCYRVKIIWNGTCLLHLIICVCTICDIAYLACICPDNSRNSHVYKWHHFPTDHSLQQYPSLGYKPTKKMSDN